MIVVIEVGIIAAQDAATVVAADIVLVKTALAERVMIVLNGAFLIDAVATVVTDYGQMVGTVLTEPVTLYLKHLSIGCSAPQLSQIRVSFIFVPPLPSECEIVRAVFSFQNSFQNQCAESQAFLKLHIIGQIE